MPLWLFLGAANGVVAVAAGGYGYHDLGGDPGAQKMVEIGVLYQLVHAVALLAVAGLAREAVAPVSVNVAGAAFAVGIVLFSGTLYVYALAAFIPVEGAAPVGGLLLMIGWLALMWTAVGVWRRK